MGVASFADGQLLIDIARLVALGNEPEVGADVAGTGEAIGISDGQDKGGEVIGPTPGTCCSSCVVG